ncbi:MAG: hypothetical protein VXY92_01105 [Planctomycetota bacterium]|nr:hypothetical protein [Planctomycetota bacterium]
MNTAPGWLNAAAAGGADSCVAGSMHGTQMGTPTSQRCVVRVDEQGHAQSCKGHVMFGAGEPSLSFSANYARK